MRGIPRHEHVHDVKPSTGFDGRRARRRAWSAFRRSWSRRTVPSGRCRGLAWLVFPTATAQDAAPSCCSHSVSTSWTMSRIALPAACPRGVLRMWLERWSWGRARRSGIRVARAGSCPGHRRQLCVTPLVRHAAPPAPLVGSVKPECYACAPELARWRQERRVRRLVRISLTRISGCSKAAKWPPLSASP